MRRNVVRCALFSALAVSAIFAVAAVIPPQQKAKSSRIVATSYGNADAISVEELKTYDYFLASDQLEGRYLPSRGFDTAALYVASHLSEWGLKPGGSTSGTNGPLQPYLMPFELVSTTLVPTEMKASITAPAPAGRGGIGGGGGRGARGGAATGPRTTDYEYGKDWTAGGAAGAGGGRGGSAIASADMNGGLVFAGNGYVINKSNTNPYQGLDVHGKIIVIAGLPPEMATAAAAAGRGRGGAGGSTLGAACTDYLTPEQYGAKNGAVGVVSIANYAQAMAMSNSDTTEAGGRGGRGGAALNPGAAFQVKAFQTEPACPVVPQVTVGLDMTNALFTGEKISPSQVFASALDNSHLDSFALNAEKTASLHIATHTESGHAENVVGILEGSDPALKSEFVVISAHLDHIGLSNPLPDGHNVNNGADDDGSGSTGLLGVAHAFATGAANGIRPKRTIIFLWNAGEERGLWGSEYFNRFPPVDIGKVVVNLNMDMIGRTRPGPDYVDPPSYKLVNPNETFVVGPNISSAELEKTIESVNSSFQKMTLNHFYDVTHPDQDHDNLGPTATGQRIFYRSDHYNFARNGIPIAFFSDGLHVDYHRPTDTPEKIDYKEIQSVSKTVAAVGWVISNEAEGATPKLNSQLPDDLLRDMAAAKANGWGKLTPVMPPLPGEPY